MLGDKQLSVPTIADVVGVDVAVALGVAAASATSSSQWHQ